MPRDWPLGRHLATSFYLAPQLAYAAREAWLFWRSRAFNLRLAGTALSWHADIVLFKSSLAFTLLQVVAHGAPYLALV